MSNLALRPAIQLDAKSLFNLRNHPEVRRRSNNPDEIDFKTHCQWFDKVMLDQNKKILIAEQDAQFVGMVRFEKTDEAYLMSWAVSPEVHGQGIGKSMLKNAIESMGNHRLVAEIKEDNLASISIAESAGMTQVGKTKDTLLYQK